MLATTLVFSLLTAPAQARSVDPGDIFGLRHANKAWGRCKVERKPLAAAFGKATAKLNKAAKASERARAAVSGQRKIVKGLLAEAKAAKKASKLAKDPERKKKLRQLALEKSVAADRAATRLAKLRDQAAVASTTRAKAQDAANRARRKLDALPCPKPVFSPKPFSAFNYPKSPSKATRTTIRYGVLHAIKHSPPGARIRIAVYSFVDPAIARALIRAKKRGVSVQVIASRNELTAESKSWARVKRELGRATAAQARTRSSWARECVRSCRGYGGFLHAKLYLFTQVGHTRWVSMLSSANLTRYAIEAQWNHLDTVIGKATYQELSGIFDEMLADRPSKRPFRRFHTPHLSGMVFPKPGTSAADDPTLPMVRNIECAAPKGTGVLVKERVNHPKPGEPKFRMVNRTVVRISMYAWFDPRGIQLARIVRQKWNEGCDVKIVVGAMNRLVKQALRGRGGRGPIPTKVLLMKDPTGHLLWYDHSKYLAINGGYAGKGQRLVWTGSMNFTGFGFSNDEIVVRINGPRVFGDYSRNFAKVWSSRFTKRPTPLR